MPPGGGRRLTKCRMRQQAQGSQILRSDVRPKGLWRVRHFVGFILALAVSAALFFAAGWGVSRFITMRGGQGLQSVSALTSPHNVLPIAAVLGTGLLVGLVVAVRWVSPLAAGLPGLVLLAWSGLLLLRGNYALTFMPLAGSRYAQGFSSMLLTGVLAVIGTSMILPLLIPARWRRRQLEIEDVLDDEGEFSVNTALGLAP